MKKMKGVVPVMTEPSPSPYDLSFDDPRAVFRHQSLLQDYEELFKETEAKKKRLEMMRQKRSVLLAEVKFLRRRYKFLMQNQLQNPPEKTRVQPQKSMPVGKNMKKERKSGANGAASQHQTSPVDLKQKGKILNGTKITVRRSILALDLNQRQKTCPLKDFALRNSTNIPDLSQKERISSGKEASSCKVTPIFDLNQISREEEELQHNGDAMLITEPRFSSIGGASDEQLNDMKVTACRNAGNGSSRTGKRKISWQDPVALRV